MSGLKHKDLKSAFFTTPQINTSFGAFERYVIENMNDLNAFAKKFPQIKEKPFNMFANLKRSLDNGEVLILTDEHRNSGFPTYCTESSAGNTHPSSIHRVKISE